MTPITAQTQYTHLLADLAGGAKELVAAHADQMGAEVKVEAGRATSAVALFAAAGSLFGIGVAFTLIVAMLTFVAHYRLPYKKMLVLTGIMLGAVLTVMIGENVQELQQCNWLPQHTFATWPQWTNVWFAVAPDWETVIAQLGAIVFVVGSYYLARRVCAHKAPADSDAIECIVPNCDNCEIAHLHSPIKSDVSAS